MSNIVHNICLNDTENKGKPSRTLPIILPFSQVFYSLDPTEVE